MNSYSSAKSLTDTLTDIYSKMPTFTDPSDKSFMTNFPKENRLFKRLHGQFTKVLAKLRKTGQDAKFDKRGAYFPKYDKNGCEQFIVRLTRTEHAFVLVSAPNREVAIKTAITAKATYGKPTVTTEDWSR